MSGPRECQPGNASDILLELADRCEKATGPDRELDILIGYAIDLKGDDAHLSFRKSFDVCGMEETLRLAESHHNIWRNELPRYTASIDAAMTLVPGGIHVLDLTLSWDTLPDNGHPACTLRWYPSDTSDKKSWHACVCSGRTAALAICNAALTIRARTAAMEPAS